MNNIILRLTVAAGLLATVASPANARLRESASDLQKRFGPPLKQIQHPGSADLTQNQYLNHDLLIYVTLYRNISMVEHYLKLKKIPAKGEEPVVVPMPRDLADAILQAGAESSKWQQVGETDLDVKFAREDKQALAVILKRNRIPVELRICDINFVHALVEPRQK